MSSHLLPLSRDPWTFTRALCQVVVASGSFHESICSLHSLSLFAVAADFAHLFFFVLMAFVNSVTPSSWLFPARGYGNRFQVPLCRPL